MSIMANDNAPSGGTLLADVRPKVRRIYSQHDHDLRVAWGRYWGAWAQHVSQLLRKGQSA